MSIDIEAIRARADAATELIDQLHTVRLEYPEYLTLKNGVDGVPALIAEVERLRDLLADQNVLLDKQDIELATVTTERDAAVKDIEKMMMICEKGSCHFCANGDCTESPYCSPKWRGERSE